MYTVVLEGEVAPRSSLPNHLPEVVSTAGVGRGVAGYNPKATACRSGRCRTGLAVSACNNSHRVPTAACRRS